MKTLNNIFNVLFFLFFFFFFRYDCQFNCTDERQNYATIASLHASYPNRELWMTEICYAYNGDDPNCRSAATMST